MIIIKMASRMEQAFRPSTFKEIFSVARDQSLTFDERKRIIALSKGIKIPPKVKQNMPMTGPKKKKSITERIFNVEFDSGPSFRPNVLELRRAIKSKRKAPTLPKLDFSSSGISVPSLGKKRKNKKNRKRK